MSRQSSVPFPLLDAPPTGVSRRRLLLGAGASVAGLSLAGLWPASLPAADKPAPSKAPAGLPPLNRFPRMVQEYFVQQVRMVEQAAEKARRELQTKDDAERYVQSVRRKCLESFGPFPEKTPLNPKITGVVERDAYRIEKVIF